MQNLFVSFNGYTNGPAIASGNIVLSVSNAPRNQSDINKIQESVLAIVQNDKPEITGVTIMYYTLMQ